MSAGGSGDQLAHGPVRLAGFRGLSRADLEPVAQGAGEGVALRARHDLQIQQGRVVIVWIGAEQRDQPAAGSAFGFERRLRGSWIAVLWGSGSARRTGPASMRSAALCAFSGLNSVPI